MRRLDHLLNPLLLMALWFGVVQRKPAQRMGYLLSLKNTQDGFEITTIIAEFLTGIARKIRSVVRMPI